MKNQILALLTLLPVVGVLWLLIQYLPVVGDWMGETADKVVSGAEMVELSPQDEAKPAETPQPALPPERQSPDFFREQIVEQLGGADRVEVRHLALSDDETRLVAALQLTDDEGGKELVEVFFERDEFGRYLSTDDSPVDHPLKLWAE